MSHFEKAATGVLALLLVGCGTTLRGRVSAPLGEPKWTKRDYTWELREPEFLLSVGAANFHPDGKPRETSALTVWVRVKPLSEGVSFDPHRITLSSEEVTEVSPASIRGPYPISFETGMRLPRSLECSGAGVHTLDGWGLGGSSIAQGQIVAMEKKVCFGLDFEVDASPTTPFTLTIDGLEVGGVPVPPREVKFREARYEIYIDGYHGTPDYVFVRPVSGD